MRKNPVTILKNGGIGVLPTDTLYGIVGQALNKKTVERIYTVKGRTPTKPLIILISSISDLKKFSVSITVQQGIVLAKVWPGKVSVILQCSNKKFEYLHRGTKSLAFRFPKNKKLLEILKKTGPLVAPSANPEGKEPAETISQSKKYFDTEVDFYISGGRKKGNPSTLVSLIEKTPKVLRGSLKNL